MDFKKLLKTINTPPSFTTNTSHSHTQASKPRYNFSLFFETFEMGFRLPAIRRASFTGSQASSKAMNVPKGYLAVYIGDQELKRFVIPVSYLNQPSFQDLLSQAEEEFGYDHPMGGLTIPCTEDAFLHVTSRFNGI